MTNFGRQTISQLNDSLNYLKKLEKFIKSTELLNRYYESGHIKIYSKENLPIAEVSRGIYGNPEYMEKSTKDKITAAFRKKGMYYVESWDAYVLN